MGLKVTNNAFGTLNAGITNSDTTVVLQSGQGSRFPSLSSGDYFYATLIDTSNNLEIVKVTARSTDTMTIVRAQDNTTARAYSTNDRFELRPTAAMLNEVITKADTAQATADAALPKAGGTMTGDLKVGGDAFGQPIRRLVVREDATDSSFKGLKVVNGGGSGAVSGVYLQSYDWVQGGIWHGRSASGTERSGALVLGTNPNTSNLSEGGLVGRLIIDNDGRVRMPYQPAFHAYAYSDAGQIASGYFTYPATLMNRGGHYNASNGRFTAPVAGAYHFVANVQLYGTSTGTTLELHKNGTLWGNQSDSRFYDEVAGAHDNIYGFAIIELAAGDYVQVYRNSTTRGMQCHFTGFLIG